MNYFLNETCKNALNIDIFFNTIVLTLDDLTDAEEEDVGYVKNISNQILKYYKKIDVELRPYHCSDEKRKSVYVKMNDVWINQNIENIFFRFVKLMSFKNLHILKEWQKIHVNYNNGNHNDSEKNLNILNNIMAGCDDDEIYKNVKKVVDILIKESVIIKSNYFV